MIDVYYDDEESKYASFNYLCKRYGFSATLEYFKRRKEEDDVKVIKDKLYSICCDYDPIPRYFRGN